MTPNEPRSSEEQRSLPRAGAGPLYVSDQRVPQVIHRTPPQVSVVTERLHPQTGDQRLDGGGEIVRVHATVPWQRLSTSNIRLPRLSCLTPATLNQQQGATRTKSGYPLPQSGLGVGKSPHKMPGNHQVELLISGGWRGRIADEEVPGETGGCQFGLGTLDHPRRQVDTGHSMSGRREQLGQRACPATDIEDITRRDGRPAAEKPVPRGTRSRCSQTVIGLVVEGFRCGVPVVSDLRCISHTSILAATTDIPVSPPACWTSSAALNTPSPSSRYGAAGRLPIDPLLDARTGEVQRRSLLCNGVLLFEDTGELLPDGQVIDPVMRRAQGAAA